MANISVKFYLLDLMQTWKNINNLYFNGTYLCFWKKVCVALIYSVSVCQKYIMITNKNQIKLTVSTLNIL